ncbi:type II toxin-antitoxin system YafO family toxin [Kalamiella sp. sgz302252]|uniref:type II toxin-antitoxin system YafO family toxin n=1 Tax=Pantoea sp. sgz302252 TaxID=3341827 RepID=UPI0036D3D58C
MTSLQGSVYLDRLYKEKMVAEQATGSSELYEFKKAFKIYWKTGFHPSFGKDTPFRSPSGILTTSIRHAHLLPEIFTDAYGPAGTKLVWTTRTKRTQKAVSDIYLVYAVNVNRDACLLAILHNAHKTVKSDSFMEKLMVRADFFYEKTGAKPMPLTEHCNLWNTAIWGA